MPSIPSGLDHDEYVEESQFVVLDLGADLNLTVLQNEAKVNNGIELMGIQKDPNGDSQNDDELLLRIGSKCFVGKPDHSIGTNMLFRVFPQSTLNHETNSNAQDSDNSIEYHTNTCAAARFKLVEIIPKVTTKGN